MVTVSYLSQFKMTRRSQRKRQAAHVPPSLPKRVRAMLPDQESKCQLQGDRLAKMILKKCLPSEIRAIPEIFSLVENLLMTKKEALTERAKIGDLWLLMRMLNEFGGDISEAVAAAAGNNQLTALTIFPSQRIDQCDLTKAVILAVRNGHLDMAEKVWDNICGYGTKSENILLKIVEEAALTGEIEVVEFAAERVSRLERSLDGFMAHKLSNALYNAILGGHVDVVEVLLNPYLFQWNVEKALDLAVCEGQLAIAQIIYRVLPDYITYEKMIDLELFSVNVDDFRNEQEEPMEDLLVRLARDGHLNSVKYVFYNGHNVPEVLNDAIENAYQKKHFEIVSFLKGRGVETPDSVFENTVRFGSLASVKVSYEKGGVSSQCLNTVFETASSVDILEFLFGKGGIATEAINTALCNTITATGSMTPRQRDIVKFLYLKGTISSELVGTALERAVAAGFVDVVKKICSEQSASAEMIAKAFICAVEVGNGCVLKYVCDSYGGFSELVNSACMTAFRGGSTTTGSGLIIQKRAFAETVAKGLLRAARKGHAETITTLYREQGFPSEVIKIIFIKAVEDDYLDIVKLLIHDPNLTKTLKGEGLASAARHGRGNIVKFIGETEAWSLDELHEALGCAKCAVVETYLREEIDKIKPST